MLNDLKLKEDDYVRLIKHCSEKKIEFLATAFDNKSLDLLKKFIIFIIVYITQILYTIDKDISLVE